MAATAQTVTAGGGTDSKSTLIDFDQVGNGASLIWEPATPTLPSKKTI